MVLLFVQRMHAIASLLIFDSLYCLSFGLKVTSLIGDVEMAAKVSSHRIAGPVTIGQQTVELNMRPLG
jgi:hypothetical protein